MSYLLPSATAVDAILIGIRASPSVVVHATLLVLAVSTTTVTWCPSPSLVSITKRLLLYPRLCDALSYTLGRLYGL